MLLRNYTSDKTNLVLFHRAGVWDFIAKRTVATVIAVRGQELGIWSGCPSYTHPYHLTFKILLMYMLDQPHWNIRMIYNSLKHGRNLECHNSCRCAYFWRFKTCLQFLPGSWCSPVVHHMNTADSRTVRSVLRSSSSWRFGRLMVNKVDYTVQYNELLIWPRSASCSAVKRHRERLHC